MNSTPLLCRKCNSELKGHYDRLCCSCEHNKYRQFDGVYVESDNRVENIEATIRDKQAKGYLQHSKFPTQISNFKRWLSTLPEPKKGDIALDLGCGPGPYTKHLLEKGYDVMAIDFSVESLLINRRYCFSDKIDDGNATFIQKDLNDIYFRNESCSVVVMADFLQHLGSRSNRERLLLEAFNALKNNGSFYLSFFNINVKNYLKGDIHGGFAGGKIRYERMVPGNVIRYFPEDIVVKKINPMNVVHNARTDYFLTKMPMAMLIARMASIEGTRILES